ncbi:MAG TPA: trypsin-like peptidase domain-containing protein [Caldilineaceae bacterium]|nr:trypsin-like peptidase domain-containing protein [Caldilineaceae bacterium]
MSQSPYELLPARQPRAGVARRWLARLGWSAAIAAMMVLGALYGPLLLEGEPVTARQEAAAPATGITAAPALQNTASLLEDQEALADLYAQVVPSVVNIQVTGRGLGLGIPGFGIPEGEPPLELAQGSGFIYDDQGHIITNNHVVEDAEEVLVVFNNGFWADAEVVAADPQADLAVIKVTPPEGMEWRPLPLEEPNTLRVGHTVIAIGNPFGLDGTMTTGVVSALGRGIPVGDMTINRYTLPDVIQTDAAINPGNSGGPLIDLNGRVVGVNFAIRSTERVNSGVGFAIPVSIVHRVVPALIAEGRYAYAYLGLTGSSISASLAQALELPPNRLGVYVNEIIPGGPAEQAGLRGGEEVVTDENGIEFNRGGDIIIAIDDQKVVRFEDLVSYLVTRAEPGQTVTLTVIRDEETIEVPVTLGERPATTGRPSAPSDPSDGINAREAIAIATAAAEESGLLTAEIEEKVATPDTINGIDVWIVELTTANETATVTIDALSGEVLELNVE